MFILYATFQSNIYFKYIAPENEVEIRSSAKRKKNKTKTNKKNYDTFVLRLLVWEEQYGK